MEANVEDLDATIDTLRTNNRVVSMKMMNLSPYTSL